MTNKMIKKNEILKNSIELMYSKGYNGTSVKDITDAAGIPKGSFYTYFTDKENYAVDALNYYAKEMQSDQLKCLSNPELQAIERITTFFENSIAVLESKGYRYGCLIGNLCEEMADHSQLIAKATSDIHKKIVEMIHKNLIEANEAGLLNERVPLDVLASFILSSWQGAMLRMKSTKEGQVLEEFYSVLVNVLLK